MGVGVEIGVGDKVTIKEEVKELRGSENRRFSKWILIEKIYM